MSTIISDSGIAFNDGSTLYSAVNLGTRNRIINGAMQIDQRNAGAAVTVGGAAVYVADRFYFANTTGGGTLTVQQSTMTGYGKSLKATATAAITTLTSTNFVNAYTQPIEAQNCYDLNSKTVTVSFKVETNWTGNLGVAIRNSGATRSYIANVAVVSGINVCSVSIPLEATTIATNDNAAGVYVSIGVCSEGMYQTATAGSWVAGNYSTSTSSTQWCKTTGNFVNITQVQLEVGAAATPFEFRPYGMELALCQRYYEKSYDSNTVPGTSIIGTYLGSLISAPCDAVSGQVIYNTAQFRVEKRALPSLQYWDMAGNNSKFSSLTGGGAALTNNVGALSNLAVGTTGMNVSAVPGAANMFAISWAVSAEL